MRLQLGSYPGRFAAEHPFVELAGLIESARSVHRSASQASRKSVASSSSSAFSDNPSLSRAPSYRTTVSSVDSEDYSKLDLGDGDLERQPLRGAPSQAQEIESKPSRWRLKSYLRTNWRDVLVGDVQGTDLELPRTMSRS